MHVDSSHSRNDCYHHKIAKQNGPLGLACAFLFIFSARVLRTRHDGRFRIIFIWPILRI